MLIEHLEKHLGLIDYGWEITDKKYPISVARFRDQPSEGIYTYSTLGLSEYELAADSRTFRQELIFSAYEKFDSGDIASFLLSFSEFMIDKNRALLRGDKIGPSNPIVPSSKMNSIYATMPVFFERTFFELKETNKSTILVWIMPIYSSELAFVSNKGWNAFEDLLETANCDFWDLNRASLM